MQWRGIIRPITFKTRKRYDKYDLNQWKQRKEWGRWKCETWNNGKGNNGTKMSQNAGVETARNGINGTKLQGMENARHEYSGKAEYEKPLVVKYTQTQTKRCRKFSCRPATPRDSCTCQPLHHRTYTACYNGLRGWGGENKPPYEHPAIKEESVLHLRRLTNQDLHFPVRQWCQSLNTVSHSVGAHSNALREVDNPSDTDGGTAAAEPQEQHTQPCTRRAVWRPCRAGWSVPHPTTWIASGTGALRPLQILRILRKRGSPHGAWLSTVPHAERYDSAFVMAAPRSRCGHYIFAVWFLLLSSIFFLA